MLNEILFSHCSARRGHRASSRRKVSIPKSSLSSSVVKTQPRGKTWSQTMRNLVRSGFNKAATLSKRTGRRTAQQTLDDITNGGGGSKKKVAETSSPVTTQPPEQQSSPSVAVAGTSSASITAYEPVYALRKVAARRHPSAETEASGTGSSQTWEDCGKPQIFVFLFLAGFFYSTADGRSFLFLSLSHSVLLIIIIIHLLFSKW